MTTIELDTQDFEMIFSWVGFELKIAKYKFTKSEMLNLLHKTLKEQRLQCKHLREIIAGWEDNRQMELSQGGTQCK